MHLPSGIASAGSASLTLSAGSGTRAAHTRAGVALDAAAKDSEDLPIAYPHQNLEFARCF
jgi:hypothetical protein